MSAYRSIFSKEIPEEWAIPGLDYCPKCGSRDIVDKYYDLKHFPELMKKQPNILSIGGFGCFPCSPPENLAKCYKIVHLKPCVIIKGKLTEMLAKLQTTVLVRPTP